MQINLAIIGKHSYIGSNLIKDLKFKKNVNLHSFSYENFKKIKNLNNFNFILNTAIKKNFKYKKYNKFFDIDYEISKFSKKNNCKQILLSTRKIYPNKPNLRENSKVNPQDRYSKNKLISEKNCLKIKKKT